jgi:tetratricopeptide (TPR) repeat protein
MDEQAAGDAPAAPRLYSTDMLAEAIGVPAERICLWISQGLLEPTSRAGDAYFFDFKQMTAAQTLRELADSGANLKKLRRGMKRLRRWLPDEHVQRLVPGGDDVRVRLDEGELAEADGQLRLEFDEAAASPVAIATAPRTAAGWFDLGAAHYAGGAIDAAIEAFRRALQLGGPDAKVAFSLAQALAETGQHEQAAERYLQVIELDPQNADAWNNLGVVLCALNQHESACQAYRQALDIRPDDLRARYNLADLLDELGQPGAAAPHWRAYLHADASSVWAAHARRRLAAT